MGSPSLTFFLLCITSFPSLLLSQQPYIGSTTADCYNQHNSSSGLGYFCNGVSRSCTAYLTFNSQPPYQSVAAIYTLLGSDPSLLAQANVVAQTATFPPGKKVVVPVNCSCSGGYYQFNTSYRVQTNDTYLIVANSKFQGLSTCQAIMNTNPAAANGRFLIPGSTTLTVPLRCACPTRNQTSDGAKYLLSYLVDEGDNVNAVSLSLGVATQDTLNANGLSFDDATIYPLTTLLVPLKSEPNASLFTAPSPPPPSPPPPPPSGSSSSNRTGLYAGIGVAVAAVIALVSIAIFCMFYQKKRKRDINQTVTTTDPSDIYQSSSEKKPIKGQLTEEILSDIAPALKVYKYQELLLATEDFGVECRIEGSVYRAVLNGDAAAVKKMNRDVSEEISILKKINHFNLIGLSGVCFNQGTWYLVYEYMESGSLSKWIFDRTGSKVLSWLQRVQIALDVANGLHYLHSYTEPPHVHKDVRSSNILLDGNLRAKVANFSLARAAEGKEGGFVLTRHIVGTVGYMAPEYLEHGLISPKLDVYALGIVMMELFTAKEAVATRRGGDLLLMEALRSMLKEEDPSENLRGFMDPLLEGNYPVELALLVAKLIDGCLKTDAGDRPSMEEIAHSLSRILATSLAWVLSKSPGDSQSFSSAGEPQSEQRIDVR